MRLNFIVIVDGWLDFDSLCVFEMYTSSTSTFDGCHRPDFHLDNFVGDEQIRLGHVSKTDSVLKSPSPTETG
jgi:hypothetical protein